MSDVLNGVFWFLILWFISFWVASIAFFPFIVVSVFLPCISGLQCVYDFLMLCITFPYKCSDNMVNCNSCNSF